MQLGQLGLAFGGMGARRGGGAVVPTPATLFAASEPGFWFDPSDLSTLYQDAAGTTPVTAAGQIVGLMLDKSKGLVLGPEIATNGDFSGGNTGWALQTGWTIASGAASVNSAVLGSTYIRTTTPTVIGRLYSITFTVTSYTSGSLAAAAGTATASPSITSTGTFTRYVFADSVGGAGVFAANANTVATIDNISVRELPGNHATQSTSLSRPTYQVDSNGRGHLLFDGSDDFLVTPTITPGTDKAQVFAGVRKLSDAARGMVLETGTGGTTGAILLNAPTSSLSGYGFGSFGSMIPAQASSTLPAAPSTNILTGIGDIANDTAILRVNGAQAASSTGDQGTGNYLAYPAYIGRRGGTLLPFNGRIYSLICRFGSNLTADQIAQTEAWINSKTGAY